MDWWYRYQKIILILVFISFTVFMSWLMYTVFFSAPAVEPDPVPPGTISDPAAGGLPEAGPGTADGFDPQKPITPGPSSLPASQASAIAGGGHTQTKELSQEPVLGATLAGSGREAQYYNMNDGKFYRVDGEGKVSALSNQVFHQVQKVTWSPQKNLAILEYPDQAKIIYNFDTEKQISLPAHWKDFDFSPQGTEIISKSMGMDPENRWLVISNTDGSRIQALEALGAEDYSVHTAWSPNDQVVALHTKGIDLNRQEVLFIGKHSENFQSMIVAGRGFDPLWSPQGDRLLYSVYSSDTAMKPNLWISDASADNAGGNRRNLSIETWASKCVYADSTILYCAVPEYLETGAGIFPETAASTKDRLYEINTSTGLRRLVAIPEGSYNMSDLSVSDDASQLFYTDRTTNKLYGLRLK